MESSHFDKAQFLQQYVQNKFDAKKALEQLEIPFSEWHTILSDKELKIAIEAILTIYSLGAGETLGLLAQIARGSIAPFLAFNARGEFMGIRVTKDTPNHLIKKLFIKQNGDLSIELYDAQRALEVFAKHHALIDTLDLAKVPTPVLKLLSEIDIGTLKLLCTLDKGL